MSESPKSDLSRRIIESSFLLTVCFSLTALMIVFFVSNSALDFETKTLIFVGVAFVYLFISAGFYFWQRTKIPESVKFDRENYFTEDIESKLFALEEANEFFGASLKSADMFRLVASRIGEIIPFSACVLYLAESSDASLKIKYAIGKNSQKFAAFEGDLFRSSAVKVFLSRKPLLDSELNFDRRVFDEETLQNFFSSMAMPLFRRGEIYGVLVLYSDATLRFDDSYLKLFEAVATRVAPLFAGSFAFENSMTNALTDSLTNLPNERALFLMLENQIAESQRFREERPLTVLAIDIRGFDELNKKYGHAVGDGILEFTAENIKKQMRQMDILSRSAGDEFLAVLPRAGEEIAIEVKERIRKAFVKTPFIISPDEHFYLELNFGSANFWSDGETANALLQTAMLRKQQGKSGEPSNVLWFPKEFVN